MPPASWKVTSQCRAEPLGAGVIPPSTRVTELQYLTEAGSGPANFTAISTALIAVTGGAGGCLGIGGAADNARAIATQKPIVITVFFMIVFQCMSYSQ
jgi:hypothetical protein